MMLVTKNLAGAHKPRLWASILTILFLCACGVATAGQSPRKHLPSKPLDLNKAAAEELAQLPGIGPTTAKAIVRFRKTSGPFRRVEDLLAIRGITKRRLEKLRPYVAVPASPAPAN